MSIIYRDASKASNQAYDLIIVGGGIYGVMLSLEASQRGLITLLLERDDFGGATSYNSLRIVHGGLRYLQSLDFHRFFESVAERKWFLQNFPGLIKPLPCLMPLYDRGLHRPSILGIALKLNDLLSIRRNKGVIPDCHLHSGKIISTEDVKRIFPAVNTDRLKGGALWYDGSMPDTQRVVIEILKKACSLGATAINYCEVQELSQRNGSVEGVVAIERESAKVFQFRATSVVNAAGPWCRELAARFDRDYQNLFRSSLAWNVLFDRAALSDHALAITPQKPNARTYFLRPWKGMLLAGTFHEPWSGVERHPIPSDESLTNFIDDLNQTIRGLNLTQNDIVQIFSGLLPAKETGSNILAVREVILDHADQGGPKGLYSVSGVKFTTARLVAEKTINKIFPDLVNSQESENSNTESYKFRGCSPNMFDFRWQVNGSQDSWKKDLQNMIAEESVLHLDDLILRRTSIGDNPARAMNMAPLICDLFDWDEERRTNEIERLENYYRQKLPKTTVKW